MAWFDRFRRPSRIAGSAVGRHDANASSLPAPLAASDIRPRSEPRFVVLDVETTGLAASTHRVIELALLTTDVTGKVLEEWTTRLNPQGPVGATHIHGITDADVRHAPLFSEVIDELNGRLAGAALVAHNARFDLAFLRAEYARASWRLPYLPALCTLEASTHHLPHLSRRRLTDCCSAIGHSLEGAHSALGDARATASLLRHYLHPGHGVPAHPDHLRMPYEAAAVSWPPGPESHPIRLDTTTTAGASARQELSARARRNVAALNLAKARTAQSLVQLIERFSLAEAVDEGAPAGSIGYLEKLAEVLEDGVLTADESADLREVAALLELNDGAVTAAHRAFVLALAHAALADGKVTRAETDELRVVAALLDVESDLIPSLLARAEQARHARLSAGLSDLPADWQLGQPLRVGDKVVFTGCEGAGRDELERRSTELGVRVLNSVSSKTAMLVSDDTMLGGKHQKAVALGIRTVDPSTYRVLLEHLQPAADQTPAAGASEKVQSSPSPSADTLGALAAEASLAPLTADPAASPAVIRAWGRDHGWQVGQRGRLPAGLTEAYVAAHSD